MSKEIIKIPDVGSDQVEVIEICVAVGDVVAEEDSLVVLESDKASMEVPSPKAGKIVAILVSSGQQVGKDDDLIELEISSEDESAVDGAAEGTADEAAADTQTEVEVEGAQEQQAESAEAEQSAPASEQSAQTVEVPDIGTEDAVDVIEVCVSEGDEVAEGDSLIVLESDKASMEIPAPYAGKVESISLKVGDSAKQGDVILKILAQAPAAEEKAPSGQASSNQSDSSQDKTSSPSPAAASAPLKPAERAPEKAAQSEPPTPGDQVLRRAGGQKACTRILNRPQSS